MPAGPGDCAGLLIHLKAEDLCCCFQGAWPTMNAHAHMHKNNQQHKNAATPHKHTHACIVLDTEVISQMETRSLHVNLYSDSRVLLRCFNQEIHKNYSQVGSNLWILCLYKRGQKENSNLNLQAI